MSHAVSLCEGAVPICESRYLLPGIAKCAWCNGGIHVRTRYRRDGQRAGFYVCTSHFNRGESVCRNLVQMPMVDVDAAVLRAVSVVLAPDMIEEVLTAVRQELEPARRSDPRERIRA
jgi:hypothetical protein